jgi:hypothetical protein
VEVFDYHAIPKEENMRRRTLTLLSLAAFLTVAPALFADNALVLPAGVFRTRLVPAYGWIPGSYDTNGNYTPYSSSTTVSKTITAPNFGAVLEYGINDWISAGVSWAPGVTVSSSVSLAKTTTTGNVDGLSDLFVGLKAQIVGEKAPVQSDSIRVTLMPGVEIPLGGADFASQYTNMSSNSAYTLQNPALQLLGIGGLANFDYLFTKSFFIDLSSEFIYYPGTVAFKDTSVVNYYYYNSLKKSGITYNPDVGYGYELKLKIDPNYSIKLGEGVTLSADASLCYDASPAPSYSTTLSSTLSSAIGLNTNASWDLSLNPAISVFFTKTLIPFEVEIDYSNPLAGVNTTQSYSLDLQLKTYFKF